MHSFFSTRHVHVSRFLIAAVLSYACVNSVAAQGVPGASSGDALVVGLPYVPPAFVPGAKVRTPESIATALVADLAARLSVQARSVPVDAGSQAGLPALESAGLLLVPIADPSVLPASMKSIATGYSSGAMAIMRTDTDIKKWEQLKGRTVCLAEGGRYTGQMAARYGAVEKVFMAPADSLLTLRTGGCDAAVHDSTLLNELLTLPEWKKFSARLPVQDVMPLAFVIPSSDARSDAMLRNIVKDWADNRYLETLTKSAAKDIAFEVYLDQTVTDCH